MLDYSALRADLANFTRDNLSRIIGPDALAALDRDEAVPAALAARRMQDSGSDGVRQVALQLRWLWLGEALTEAELGEAFPSEGAFEVFLQGSARALFTLDGTFVADFQLLPFGKGFWFASDRGSLQGARHGSEHVMGIGGATRTLVNLASYREGQRVLDLGTGCGIHAILAASEGADVVATDISARALEYAQFNASLNGVEIETRLGSLFEPVAGETFDVVVSNPPFVITPGKVREELGTMEYRDGGAPGDSLAHSVVREAADFLAPKGRVYMLSNWEIDEEVQGSLPPSWDDHPRSWLSGVEANAVVVQREVVPASSYVEMWLRDGGLRPGDNAYAPTYEAWLGDFIERGVGKIGFGYIVIEKVAAENSHEFVEYRGAAPDDLGAYMDTVLAGLAVSADNLDSQVLIQHALTEHRFYIPGEEDPWIIKFSQLGGFGEEMQADTALTGFVSVCTGELSAGQIIAALAELLERDVTDLRAELAPRVVHMVRLGMLTVVQD